MSGARLSLLCCCGALALLGGAAAAGMGLQPAGGGAKRFYSWHSPGSKRFYSWHNPDEKRRVGPASAYFSRPIISYGKRPALAESRPFISFGKRDWHAAGDWDKRGAMSTKQLAAFQRKCAGDWARCFGAMYGMGAKP